ncbi:putative transcription factor MYB family [Helianthus annuus]|uniref:Putative homeodomain-like superfamily protein n=1 Tax=Helianthus annuus TaxID=4232 RepID=A0A251TAH7_HELAN|nr:trihelix transcription factor GT-3b [Helianthus annuus]KAF5759486.1 putative transcription factor MYB family [Helianthus annuus]KAJ0442198.1 putative transcription factor MYB family [Helianthus annuus]KAJ0820720.1 putative transcription factor MYB family [Helianthus annuus]
MEHGHLHHISGSLDSIASGGGGASDRILQWSVQETRDFLMIRAEMDQNFVETKRNKLLWEVTSRKMMDRGYNRSAEQCKAKWKNLVTRYKGCETMEDELMRQQFPFYNDLQAIFEARMQKMLWMEAEGLVSGSKKRVTHLSSDEDDDDDNEESGLERIHSGKNKKKKSIKSSNGNNPSGSTSSNTKEILEEFMKQQMQIEMQWMKTFEEKEEERRLKEIEWQQRMESLENERIMLEQRWREREEQRMMREEARSEKRDALLNALFDKLNREGM